MSDLQGRSVLITGAASGIGRALAELASGAGASATLIDIDAKGLDAVAAMCRGVARPMNVADARMWESLPLPTNGWDYVALNAGVTSAPPDEGPEAADFATLSLERYRRIVGINIDGVALGLRKVLPDLHEGGAIVATSSAAGIVGYGPDGAYTMTKHAVVGLVRGVAAQLAMQGRTQRICAICPGGVRTNIIPTWARAIPVMEPTVIAEEILDLWLRGENGEIRARIRQDLAPQHIAPPDLIGWG